MGLIEEGHVYSFSQLQQISECPYGFYLQRIEHECTVENAFAQQGSLIHDILDQWAKGKLRIEDCSDEYLVRYMQEVTAPWPKMLASKGYADKTFELGLTYFENFDGFTGYTVISSETKFKTDIAGRPFVGIIDLILEDNETKEWIICDHKSKSLSSFKKEEDNMYRQQLVYSKHVFEKYNRWPDRLMFNLFKEGGLKKERPFTKTAYDETMRWAEQQIEKIEQFDVQDYFDAKESDFFCWELCSVRSSCENGKMPKKKR